MDSQTLAWLLPLLTALGAVLGNLVNYIFKLRDSGKAETRDERGDLERSYARVVAERDTLIKERDKAYDDLMRLKELWMTWLKDELKEAIEDARRK